MKKMYFNKLEFKQAFSLTELSPFVAKSKFEEYLQKYPKDYCTYPYYISVLITLGEFNEAEKVLDFLEFITRQDRYFDNEFDKKEFFKRRTLFNKLRLLSYQEKYQELYQLYLDNFSKFENAKVTNAAFYCKKKIGRLDFEERNKNPYLYRQIVEYQKSDFLDHIKKHLADYNVDVDTPNRSIFAPDFPIEKVIDEVEKYIPYNKKLYTGFLEDTYMFKYDENGRDKNKSTDYFKVVCFHNTKNIITMCPTPKYEGLPYVDLNYLNLENEKEWQKTKSNQKSQIEKFNERYGRN